MRGKKAVFFTILAFIFVNIFLISYQTEVTDTPVHTISAIRSRINMMNSFIESLEDDAQRALYISSFRAIVTLDNHIVNTQQPVEIPKDYYELMFNGTLNGSSVLLMDEQTVGTWRERVEELALLQDLNLTLSYQNLTINHSSPWHLISTMHINYTLEDQKGTALFTRERKISTRMLITDWHDPLFSIRLAGSRQVFKANTTDLSTTLAEHVSKGYYAANPDAPSFLMRMENKTGSSSYGIETILNVTSLGLSNPSNHSTVDHEFWSGSPPSGQETPVGDIYLDNAHCTYYNVTCS